MNKYISRVLVLGPDQNLVPIGVTKLYCDFQLDFQNGSLRAVISVLKRGGLGIKK